MQRLLGVGERCGSISPRSSFCALFLLFQLVEGGKVDSLRFQILLQMAELWLHFEYKEA